MQLIFSIIAYTALRIKTYFVMTSSMIINTVQSRRVQFLNGRVQFRFMYCPPLASGVTCGLFKLYSNEDGVGLTGFQLSHHQQHLSREREDSDTLVTIVYANFLA